jgi:hypothetical protein
MKPADVRRRMSALNEHVSAEDYKRLDRLLAGFANKPRARLSDCLAVVTTGRKGEDQLASFRAFRQRLASGAKAAGLGWTLEVDTKKRSEPAERQCWFLAAPDDRAAESAAELSRQETAVIQNQLFIPQRGLPTMGRRLVRFFVSYDNHHDAKSATSLIADLEANFRGSGNYEYDVWHQGKILTGEIKGQEIQDALERSDFGLLLLSVHRLGGSSGDVDLHELTESARPLIPVALGNLSERLNLHGLEHHQVFKSNPSQPVRMSRESPERSIHQRSLRGDREKARSVVPGHRRATHPATDDRDYLPPRPIRRHGSGADVGLRAQGIKRLRSRQRRGG